MNLASQVGLRLRVVPELREEGGELARMSLASQVGLRRRAFDDRCGSPGRDEPSQSGGIETRE